MKISVCMAVYNGSEYIREQVASILPQLGEDDEIEVVDDASQDTSVTILEGFHDSRIRIIRQAENRGVVRTFERAIREATGEIIFLSDQDDIWHPNKIATMREAFVADPRVTLVLSNGEFINSNGMPLLKQLKDGRRFLPGVLPNLIKNQYQGSTMAFRREILEAVLPFPDGIPMHDSWIGLVNAVIGKTAYLPDRLLFYRRHEGNVTSLRHRTIRRIVVQRWKLMRCLTLRLGTMMLVKRRLREQQRWLAIGDDVGAKHQSDREGTGCQRRAVVFAPVLGLNAPAKRQRSAGAVLAEMPYRPMVSIGMPVYNCGSTVGYSIASILNQTFVDWELIIIDDGSKDDTLEVVTSINDPRIVVFKSEENRGLAVRLNECVGRARGKYFARMDGDDVAYPERLRKQVEHLERHPEVDLLSAGCIVFRGDGNAYGLRRAVTSHDEICGNALSGVHLLHTNWIGKTEWFLQNPYRGFFKRSQDRELLMRTRNISCFAALPDVLLGVREDQVQLRKMLPARFFLSCAYTEDALLRGHMFYGLGGVLFQVLKLTLDVIAIGTGLQHRILRHRAPFLPDDVRQEWNEVWRQIAIKQSQVVLRWQANFALAANTKEKQ
jgi:glycosyltransferase involved in cell wall biosynthesis